MVHASRNKGLFLAESGMAVYRMSTSVDSNALDWVLGSWLQDAMSSGPDRPKSYTPTVGLLDEKFGCIGIWADEQCMPPTATIISRG